MTKLTHITGYILSGGKSSRFGPNKAMLTIQGQTLIERIYTILASVFSDVRLITNEPEAYSFLPCTKYKDIIPDKGPISGIHSALSSSRTPDVFVLSCDLPLIGRELIRDISLYKPFAEAVLPTAEGYVQPLAARYNISLIPLFERHLTEATLNSPLRSIQRIIPPERQTIFDTSEKKYGSSNYFFNLNTPEDFAELKRLLHIE